MPEYRVWLYDDRSLRVYHDVHMAASEAEALEQARDVLYAEPRFKLLRSTVVERAAFDALVCGGPAYAMPLA